MNRLEKIIEFYNHRIADKKKWVKLYHQDEYKKDRLEKYLEIAILKGVIIDLKTIKY